MSGQTASIRRAATQPDTEPGGPAGPAARAAAPASGEPTRHVAPRVPEPSAAAFRITEPRVPGAAVQHPAGLAAALVRLLSSSAVPALDSRAAAGVGWTPAAGPEPHEQQVIRQTVPADAVADRAGAGTGGDTAAAPSGTEALADPGSTDESAEEVVARTRDEAVAASGVEPDDGPPLRSLPPADPVAAPSVAEAAAAVAATESLLDAPAVTGALGTTGTGAPGSAPLPPEREALGATVSGTALGPNAKPTGPAAPAGAVKDGDAAGTEAARAAGETVRTDEPVTGEAVTGEAGSGEVADDEASVTAWSGRVKGAVASLPAAELPSPAKYTAPLAAAGGAAGTTWQRKAEELPKEAKRVLEAKSVKPLAEIPPMPSPDPIPATTEKLRGLAKRSLPDQRLPGLLTTPNGFRPTVGGPSVDTNAPPPPAPAPAGPGVRSKTPVKQINAALAEPGPTPPVPGEGQTVSGSERPPVFTVAAPHRADLAKVLARVYLDAAGAGEQLMKDARAQAYSGLDLNGKPTLKELGQDQVGAETGWFRLEVGRVADAAQIGKDALDAAVADRTKELTEKGDQDAADIAATAKEQTETVTSYADSIRTGIRTIRENWDSHWDSVAAQAKGGVDPKAVRAEETRLAGVLRSFTQEHLAAWNGVVKTRNLKLDRAGEDQITAYQEAALSDQSAQLQASVAELTDPDLLQWVKDRRREVGHAVGVLKEDVAKTVDGWAAALRVARDEGVDVVRAWADGRIGRERGWLDSLLARLMDAITTKHEETAAFADAQTDETVAALGSDLQLINDLKMKGYDALDRDGKEHLRKQDSDQQALLKAYFEGPAKGDTVLYLAKMLQIRMRRQRQPEAIKHVRAAVLDLDNETNWSALEIIGQAQNPNFSAQQSADKLWEAFEHTWGTDEDKAYEAVKGFTPEQGKAVRGIYKVDHKESLDARLWSEMSGSEYDRVAFGLRGEQAQADAAALRDAVDRMGTDEDLINRTLRNKTPAERIAIADAYRARYGEDLKTRLDGELSGDEKAVTDAHWNGNTERADAIEVKMAREAFWGPDHEKIEQVYTQVRQEATQFGDARGWTTAEIGAETARRTAKMQVEYKDYTKRDMLTDLERSFSPQVEHIADPNQREAVDQYWKGRKDLVLGMATGDLVRADAGKIQIERTGFYAKDETVNKVLALQYDRAYDNEKRDAIIRFTDENGRAPTAKEMKELDPAIIAEAEKKSRSTMDAVGLHFERNYTGNRERFADTIKDLTQGTGEDKAVALLDQAGRLHDWQVLEFATKGLGTDDDDFKKLMKRTKTRSDMLALEKAWQDNAKHPGVTIASLIESETSGRLKQDLLVDYQFGGEPEDPQEMVKKATAQLDFERRSGGAEPVFGGLYVVKNHEYQVMEQRLARLQEQASEYEAALKLPDSDPAKAWAVQSWKANVQGFASSVETHRFLVDQRTELAAQVVSMAVAITVGVVLTVATAGAGSVGAVALIAGVSALFGAAAGIATKASMKGAAYGADELGVDIAVGLVDTIISAATAGVGGKILKSAAAAAKVGGAGARGVMATLGRMAEGSVAQRATAHFLAEGAEGFLQSLPTAVLSTALNKQTWTEGNPFLNMMLGVGMGVGMGTFASGTIGGLTNLRKPGPHPPVPMEGPPPGVKSALVDARHSTADLAALESRYFELNPTRTKADFRKDFDSVLLLQAQHNPDVDLRLKNQLRDEITDLLPPAQKADLGKHPVEMWDAKRFEEFTGSKSGQAVVIIKDGQPTVIVKQGADPHELAQEGFHLVQALDLKTKAKVARLDESTMSRWSSLDVREKLQLYREKLDLELDAQRQMVAALEGRAKTPGVGEGIGERLAAAKETLADLEKRFGDMSRIGPFQRTLMAWGVLPQPRWLEQPARLFSKTRLGTLRSRVLREATTASTSTMNLRTAAEDVIAGLPPRQQRAMLEHLERAFREINLPLGKRAFEAEKIHGLLTSAADLLSPQQTRLGRGFTNRMRVGIVTRAFAQAEFQGAKNILDGAVDLVAAAATKRRPGSARRIVAAIIEHPNLDADRTLKAASGLFGDAKIRPSTIDRMVESSLGRLGGGAGLRDALDTLEGFSRWAKEVRDGHLVSAGGVDKDLRRFLGSGDARQAMVAEIERVAAAGGSPVVLHPLAVQEVGLHGLVETLGKEGRSGITLINDIAHLQQTGRLSGLGDYAQYLFHESPRLKFPDPKNHPNSTSGGFRDVINELAEARRIANGLGPGDHITIGGDLKSGGLPSFDIQVRTASGRHFYVDVRTSKDLGDLHGPVSHLVDDKITKLVNVKSLPVGASFEATGFVDFPPAAIGPAPINGPHVRANGHTEIYRGGAVFKTIDQVQQYLDKTLNPGFATYSRMTGYNVVDRDGRLLARVMNTGSKFEITFRAPP